MPQRPSPTPPSVQPDTTLPAQARLPINRCNLPAVILGSLTFQSHPQHLEIDGVRSFYADLFQALHVLDTPQQRAQKFQDYMTVKFRLSAPEDAGAAQGRGRTKADYRQMLRGWFFDADGREAAVLKSWVESRFGLLTRYHKGAIHDRAEPHFALFLQDRASGLHNTNALETQMDVLHAFCQFELAQRFAGLPHLTLYRGVNRLDAFEVLSKSDRHHQVMLFNNINSFTANRDTAGEFGDHILTVQVPVSKIVFFSGLLDGLLKGEDEYIVLGGVYAVETSTY
ncbi:NAD(+)--dinitrogen-reductase ADP-D-ribosyltransferase [Magnetovibrio blakemorei]|uniref:NAD(+)--dinitrogen-reductase ADP-D-ribosyltransferase n=1 Tax=Magnetovibrio blakemorei TaxID=28181 RepID=A0A1E5Q674_9PROT|nr:NAD(+)--dinitrogen-reductase ADP-D-ribosyltransferase [Magnetovibrio blakemorei]OEJ66237.1 NAD(+)--dinitrogen-reductase ADP-D-ribosyltransferase [Magnetovibrio blakemorei]